jgi:hypothetical protein
LVWAGWYGACLSVCVMQRFFYGKKGKLFVGAFAISALLLHFVPPAQAREDVTPPTVTTTPRADSTTVQPKPQPSSATNGTPTGDIPASLTAVSLNTAEQNSQSLSTIRVPEVQPAKPANVIGVERLPSRRNWLILSIARSSAAAFDAYSTRQAISRGAVEDDPTMRPFAHSPGIYAAIQVGPAILDFAARRMQRSQNNLLRRTWWLPQSVSTGLFLFSGTHNLHMERHP